MLAEVNCSSCGAVCSVSHMHNGYHIYCPVCGTDWAGEGMSDEGLRRAQIESLIYRIERIVREAMDRMVERAGGTVP